MTKPAVTVAIPSVSGGPRLIALLQALEKSALPADIVVADNGLPAETLARLSATTAGVLSMDSNRGFGAAVNAVARGARADVLLVINDDVTPLPGFVEALAARASAGATMVAGVLLQRNRPDRVETAGIVLDRLHSPYDYLYDEPASCLDGQAPAPPLGPSGGAAAYRTADFLKVGGFDEAFFAYGEDVDLALRLHAAGARCELAPDARAVHETSATVGHGSLRKAALVGFARGYLMRKYGILRDPLLGPGALAIEGVAGVLLSLRHRSFVPLRARLRGFRACHVRQPPPPRSALSQPLVAGLRRRYVRARPLA